MAKKTGLGKGLDALFANNIEDEEIRDNEVIEKLKITEVEPNSNHLFLQLLLVELLHIFL